MQEVALEKLSYLTVACNETKHAALLAGLMNGRYIKTIVSDDIYGTEYSAVIKKKYYCHCQWYLPWFRIRRQFSGGINLECDSGNKTISGCRFTNQPRNDSAYLGDLLVTAYSQFSRNRTFGSMVGKGYCVKSAQLEMNMIAEDICRKVYS